MLLLGPPGIGKSDLLLRLIHRGFSLVADDQVEVDGVMVRPPERLAGLLEVRGIGIFRLDYTAPVPVRLAVDLSLTGASVDRIPWPTRHPLLDVPLVQVDPQGASAPDRVIVVLRTVLGLVQQVAGCLV